MPESEPDNYSIDEMMSRLQARGGQDVEGEPQLVTRPDGSQVVRVRKRKRRSHQPHKEAEKRRRRRTLVVTSLVMVLLLTGALAFIAWFFYLNSSGYRDQVAERIEAWTGAELDMRAFRATPVNAAADTIILTWPEDSPAARLKVHAPRVDLKVSSHLTGKWQGQQLGAGSGELVLRAVESPSRVELPDEPLPFRMPIRVSRLNIRFGDGERAAFGVYEASTSLTVANPESPEANIILQSGKCRIGRWGRFDVDFASFRLSHDGVHLGTMRLAPEEVEDAEFELRGEGFPAIPVNGGKAEFGLGLQNMPSLILFGNGLGTIIEGTFETDPEDSTGRVSLDVTRLDALGIDVPVRGMSGSDLKFYRFPMFETIADVLDTARFVQPSFDPESTLRVVRTGDHVALEEIDLVSEGMMRVRGRIEERRGGALSGQLEVGIAESFLVLSETRAVPRVFGKAAGGYRWATVKLAGTTKVPSDDLARQLAGTLESIPPGTDGERGLDEEFRDLTAPQD
ncbi:hypothetical protein [Haloferula sp. A504]|uniref:hypothetical protein n=1 Tax=Haloferula sp. A504 TaxID=3373601 RepID=UPI0031C1B7F1|nr:hypothetical protein [Verrucomicrobiaceae bacterium E54]